MLSAGCRRRPRRRRERTGVLVVGASGHEDRHSSIAYADCRARRHCRSASLTGAGVTGSMISPITGTRRRACAAARDHRSDVAAPADAASVICAPEDSPAAHRRQDIFAGEFAELLAALAHSSPGAFLGRAAPVLGAEFSAIFPRRRRAFPFSLPRFRRLPISDTRCRAFI